MFLNNNSSRRTAHRLSVSVAAATVAGLGLAGSASAAGPTAPFTAFDKCPYTNTAVQSCLRTSVTSGSFKLGNAAVPINTSILLQGGFSRTGDGPNDFKFYDAVGAKTLQEVPLDVPGGLLGLVIPSEITSIPILGPLFTAAVNSVNGVTATAQKVGPIGFSFDNFNSGAGPAVSLPIRVHLENPFLGAKCYIGSADNPVTLNLTTGTTSPAAPNTPITGSSGTISFTDYGLESTGASLVDNAFGAPGASECGPFGFRWAVTPIVNLKEGLPASPGKNTAIMTGDLKLADASQVAASAQ